MRSTIIISKRGSGYVGAASGKFGGGYSGCPAGDTESEAAAFAAREMVRYGQTNSEGGDLMAPPEIMALVPSHLHSI